MPLALSAGSIGTAGVLLVTIVLIETGGLYLIRVVSGRHPLTPFQLAFARAGHAHAGVLVTLSLVALLFVDAAAVPAPFNIVASSGIPLAAILMSAGFFLSSAGEGREHPNRLIVLVYAGALSLGAGALALGLGLLF